MALENETAAVRRLKCAMWGRDCIFYTTDKNDKDGIALLNENGWKNMHFVFKSKPSGGTLDKLYRAISSDLRRGDIVSSNGGISPGGLNGLRNLAKYGFQIVGYNTNSNEVYWYGGTDMKKMSEWASREPNSPFVHSDGEDNIMPSVPILEKM